MTESEVVTAIVAATGHSARSVRDALRRHLRRRGVPVTKVGLTRIFDPSALKP